MCLSVWEGEGEGEEREGRERRKARGRDGGRACERDGEREKVAIF